MTDRYSERYSRSQREEKTQEVTGREVTTRHLKTHEAFQWAPNPKSSGYVTRAASDGLALEC